MRVGEVGACGIGARWGRSIPQTRGLTPLGERHHQPPEPGFARREANHQKKLPNHHSKRRLLKRESQAAARKEGAHGGTRGSPVKRASATRQTRGFPVKASVKTPLCGVLREADAWNQAGLVRGRECASSGRTIGRTGRLGESTQTRLFEVAKVAGNSTLLAHFPVCSG